MELVHAVVELLTIARGRFFHSHRAPNVRQCRLSFAYIDQLIVVEQNGPVSLWAIERQTGAGF
jgi:hypothetical protein